MDTQRRVANALGGKTARACDSCLTKRARWFCAADDAFLCQGCDATVHSANQVASRHERVRLDSSSSKANNCSMTLEDSLPAWQGGLTKRARTSRNHSTKSSLMEQQSKEGHSLRNVNAPPLVPEISSDETAPIDDDENFLFRVPVFDPLDDELCKMSNEVESIFTDEINIPTVLYNPDHAQANELDDFPEFLACDMDLTELAADVESLLGNGTDEDFGLANYRQDGAINICFDDSRVKVEDDQEFEDIIAPQIDSTLICSQFNAKEEETDMLIPLIETDEMKGENEVEAKRKMFLKLNYEAVLTAWGSQGLPWTTGSRPEFSLDDCWPDLTSTCLTNDAHQHKFVGIKRGGGVNASDGGREARVSRYREKRRTRLFSKKIRYEVRKLNAEKRPRIKGRFVKRSTSSFAIQHNAAIYPYLNQLK